MRISTTSDPVFADPAPRVAGDPRASDVAVDPYLGTSPPYFEFTDPVAGVASNTSDPDVAGVAYLPLGLKRWF
jgi:hypothetical protein